MSDHSAEVRPTAQEAAAAIVEVYETEDGGAGCCLHVQCDDGNLEDRFFSAEIREGVEHPECLRAFDLLAAMKQTARRKAVAMAWDMRRARD